MGALRDRAKAMSKFLILDKGEVAVIQYVGWRGAADQRDPTKEVTIYEFRENGIHKFWTNSSSKVMLALDHANAGDWVKVSRNKAVNKAGVEDPEKSSYSVELLPGYDPRTGLAMGQPVIGAQIASPAQTTGIAAAPVNNNPGGIADPADIVDPFGSV